MLKIKFIEMLFHTAIKNLRDEKINYFLVCNDTNDLYEPFYIYPEYNNEELTFTIEVDDAFYCNRTLEQLFKVFEYYDLINNDTISFYNVSELEN